MKSSGSAGIRHYLHRAPKGGLSSTTLKRNLKTGTGHPVDPAWISLVGVAIPDLVIVTINSSIQLIQRLLDGTLGLLPRGVTLLPSLIRSADIVALPVRLLFCWK